MHKAPTRCRCLAFTLERLHQEFGDDGDLRLDEYEQMEGVEGSLQAAVDQALSDPSAKPAIPAKKPAQMRLLRQAFIPWLATIDEETGEPMRQVAAYSDLPEKTWPLVERLIATRLLVKEKRGRKVVVEVAHESLLRQWDTLGGWLDAEADNLKLLRRVQAAAAAWKENKEAEDWLIHRGDQLPPAEKLLDRADFKKKLGKGSVAYLTACRKLEEKTKAEKRKQLKRERAQIAKIKEEQDKRQRAQLRYAVVLRRYAGILSLIALGVLASGVFVWQQMQQNRQIRSNVYAELARNQRTDRFWKPALRFSIAGVREAQSAIFEIDSSAAEAESAAIFLEMRSLVSLKGHEQAVLHAAFSPDGTHIVTASADDTARLWDTATGRPLIVLKGHEGWVSYATFSPDGTRIVTASDDGTARLWDASTGQYLDVMKGHEGWVLHVAFSSDGTRIVTASDDETARVWDVSTGKLIVILKGHQQAVTHAAFSPDGTRIVTASDDGTASLWDASTGRPLAIMRGHEQAVLHVAFSPDGSRIVTASKDATVRLWDAFTGRNIIALGRHKQAVSYAAFSPDGSRVLTASDDGTARLWNAHTGEFLFVLKGHEGWVSHATFSPDGTRVVTASDDGTAGLWDAFTGRIVITLKGHEQPVSHVAFSPNGRRVVTTSDDGTARLWDAPTGKILTILKGHDGWLAHAAFSSDGTHIVTASSDGTARVWDVHYAMLPLEELIHEACTLRLRESTKLLSAEMRLAGLGHQSDLVDVCAEE